MQLTCLAVDWKEECCCCHPQGQHNLQARVQQRLKVTNLATANGRKRCRAEIAPKLETLRLNSFPHLHFHITEGANNEI
jgi:hypothetical protein